jgi:hypothetical protein
MSFQDLNSYVTHLPEFKVVVCRFCEECIPPDNPLDHYESHHTATKEHPIPMEIRRKIQEYIAILNLCDPRKVILPNRHIPQLKISGNGYVCNFPGCGKCRTSEHGMRMHYYAHQKSVPKDFKNWEKTSFQTFFDGQNRR